MPTSVVEQFSLFNLPDITVSIGTHSKPPTNDWVYMVSSPTPSSVREVSNFIARFELILRSLTRDLYRAGKEKSHQLYNAWNDQEPLNEPQNKKPEPYHHIIAERGQQ